MPERRRIVPDASVMLAAYFRETLSHGGQDFDITRRAQPLLNAVQMRSVVAFAPEALSYEFLRGAYRKAHPREGRPEVALDTADQQVMEFLGLDITYVPGEEIAESAWGLTRDHQISPTDSWFVACAMQYEAELWLSHRQRDRILEAARSVQVSAFALTESRFV